MKATDSKLLVSFENKLETVKVSEKIRLKNEYNDMIEWLMMLNKNPRFKLIEELFKPVTFAFQFINEIVQIIETSEQKLKQERVDIENQVVEQQKNFVREIEEMKSQVNSFKDNSI